MNKNFGWYQEWLNHRTNQIVKLQKTDNENWKIKAYDADDNVECSWFADNKTAMGFSMNLYANGWHILKDLEQ